jgi:pyruvate formate-lyase activating enzyme-like uncharacterized protein
MRKIISWLNESSYVGPLSQACRMCAKGSKIVILITGLCSTKCFYCPLSARKIGKDRIFANEWELVNEKDINKLLKEAEYIDAEGAGITGGDPLLVWKRTKNFIKILKDSFGSDFHIHMYTSGLKNSEYIDELISVGLDEIRFHPDLLYWKKMNRSSIVQPIKNSLKTNVDVAIEIPVIPTLENDIFSLINWSNDIGIKYINLNELEFSETNAEMLNKKNLTVKDNISAAVNGSQDLAYKIIENSSDDNLEIGIHYCSSSFKDGVQLKNRIMRRAKNIVKSFEVITDEGTILKGIINQEGFSLQKIKNILKKEFNVSESQIFLNNGKNRVELPIWIIEKIAKDLRKRGFNCFIIEEYPTADSLEVERIPLPIKS